MKKFLLIFLIFSLLLTFAACSKQEEMYEPKADWVNEYYEGKFLSDNKLNYFLREFVNGKKICGEFIEYTLEHDIELGVYGDLIKFDEGKQLANGDYVLITNNRTINFAPIAIRLRVIDENNAEVIDVVPAIKIVS